MFFEGNYGFTVTVTAIFAPGQGNGQHCILNGVDQLSLMWGVFKSDGRAPDGCVAAKLVQNGPGYYLGIEASADLGH